MPERQPHPDNDLIDRLQQDGTPSQQGRSGGVLQKRVGTRAELERAEGEAGGTTRATGGDNPDADAEKGDKTRAAIQEQRNQS